MRVPDQGQVPGSRGSEARGALTQRRPVGQHQCASMHGEGNQLAMTWGLLVEIPVTVTAPTFRDILNR